MSDSEELMKESQSAEVETGNELEEIRKMFSEIKGLISVITDLHEKKD